MDPQDVSYAFLVGWVAAGVLYTLAVVTITCVVKENHEGAMSRRDFHARAYARSRAEEVMVRKVIRKLHADENDER